MNSYFYKNNNNPTNEHKNEIENGNENENENENYSRKILNAATAGRNPFGESNLNDSKNIPQNVPSWESTIWPEIKRKILATLETAQTSIIHRPRTFEFLGYDVLIDANGVPWILEVCPSVRAFLV